MTLALHVWGPADGAPLVCVHGITAHGRRFEELAGRLPGNRVLAPDLRGAGDSTFEPPWDRAQHVADLLETIAAPRATWLGHSFGGRLVLELAARAPERVERAVLLDPAIRLLPHVSEDMARAQLAVESFAAPEAAVDQLAAHPRFVRTPRERFEREARDFLEQGRDGRWRWRYSTPAVIVAFSEMCTAPPTPARVPTLLVIAEESYLVLDEQVEWLEASLGDLLTVERVTGGHTVYWDALDETVLAIECFIP